MNYVNCLKYAFLFFFLILTFFPLQIYAEDRIIFPSDILKNIPQSVHHIKNVTEYMRSMVLDNKREAPDAFYVIDVHQLVKQHMLWEQVFPRVKPFYAVKVNSDPVLLKTLVMLNTGFDCASINEINQILALGGQPNHIIFAHPIKPEASISQAYKAGITKMTFDTLDELKKMVRLAPEGEFILRIKVEDALSSNPLGEKFGAKLPEAKKIIQYAAQHNLPIQGISFHVGSNCLAISQYEKAIEDTKMLFDFANSKGVNFSYLDLGGGWPGNNNVEFTKITSAVNAALKKFEAITALKIIAEPGRFYATSPLTLAVKIIGKKEFSSKTKAYYLAEGAYGMFASSIYYGHNNKLIKAEGWNLRPLFPTTNRSEKTHRSILFGPTCDAGDRIGSEVQLPELKVGAYLYSDNMGAYTIATSSKFNQITPPVPFYVCKGC